MLAFRRNSSWRGTTLWAAAAFSGGFGREWRRRTGLAGAGRQGDMGAFEKPGHVWRDVGAHEPVGGSVMDAHLLQAVEIAQQLLPFRNEAGLAREVIEMLLHQERQEGAENVAADGGIGGMEDRSGAHDRLGPAEEVLDKEKIAIAQDRLQRGHLCVGAQDEDPVEARLLGELAGVDLE